MVRATFGLNTLAAAPAKKNRQTYVRFYSEIQMGVWVLLFLAAVQTPHLLTVYLYTDCKRDSSTGHTGHARAKEWNQ